MEAVWDFMKLSFRWVIQDGDGHEWPPLAVTAEWSIEKGGRYAVT
jgi:hypothetical protein